jgi:hypothetical protein
MPATRPHQQLVSVLPLGLRPFPYGNWCNMLLHLFSLYPPAVGVLTCVITCVGCFPVVCTYLACRCSLRLCRC